MASLPKNKKGTWKIFPGSPLKIVASGGVLFAGEATQTNEETFDFHTYETLPDEARDITVFIVDFSGINGFQTRIVARKGTISTPPGIPIHPGPWSGKIPAKRGWQTRFLLFQTRQVTPPSMPG